MALQARVTKPVLENQWHLTVINDKIKLVHLYQVQESGWECSEKQDRTKNAYKLRRHLARARDMVFQYAYCNEWDFFFTGTIDATKRNREDLQDFERAFARMVRNLRAKTKADIQYLIIPELHSDLKSWHCHGLIKGLPEEQVVSLREGKLSWRAYSRSFGFNDLSLIKNHEAVSKYLTKYITKCFDGSGRGVVEKEKNLYIVSHGLKKGETIKKGSIVAPIDQKAKFENDFCQIYEFPISELDNLLQLYQE